MKNLLLAQLFKLFNKRAFLSSLNQNSCPVLNSDKNILINGRQRNLLVKSQNIIGLAYKKVKDDVGMDIVASTLRGFTLLLEEIIGEVYDKDVIDNIFKNFCVGK